jgi:hypothetical protein
MMLQNVELLWFEEGEFDRAIEVCKIALSFYLHDEPQSGFDGRIKRIEKQRGKRT